jgi:hypothetical protein
MRADRDQHVLSVRGKDDVPGPVAAAAGQLRQGLRRAARLQVSVLVRKADDGVGVAHVHPLRIGTAGIEVDTERLFQVGGEDLHLAGLAVRARCRERPGSFPRCSPPGRCRHWAPPHQPRVVQAGGKLLHLETGRGLRPHPVRARADRGSVVGRGRGIRLGKVGDGDLAPDAGMFLGVVGKGRLAGQGLRRSVNGTRRSSSTGKADRPVLTTPTKSVFQKRPGRSNILERERPPV